MYNIFQGNSILRNTVAKSLGYDLDQKSTSFTRDIYFQTFFYLSKRFGNPSMYDSYKEAGAWGFNVKNYVIEVRMNSSWVEFMVYGKIGNHEIHSPYVVKYCRERKKKKNLIIPEHSEWNGVEQKLANELFDVFLAENNIDKSITNEQFEKEYGMKWYGKILEYNNSTINVDCKVIEELYGNSYQNSYTKHAIRTLSQFLNNMLTPIWVRDVPYNIKGEISDEEASFYKRYENNIKIEFKNNK